MPPDRGTSGFMEDSTFDSAPPGTRHRAANWSKLLSQARTAFLHHSYEETLAHCQTALQATHLRPDSEAILRCLMAEAFECLARFTEAVQTLALYEEDLKREKLSPALQSQVCLRLGSAYGGTTEIPKAVAYAKQALALAIRHNDALAISRSHLVLGTLYRRLGELWFARDHLAKILKEPLRHGDRSLLAQAYNGLGILSFLEGEFAEAKQAFGQAIEALGPIDDPLVRGSVDVNLATIATLQGQMRESVTLFESALPHLQRARNPRLIVNAYSNLGYSLLRLGEMKRAAEVLQNSLVQARVCEAILIEASTLETLGELHFMQGNFSEAEQLLAQSLSHLKEIQAGFNHAMALLTAGRGALLAGEAQQAATAFRESLEICDHMGDPRGRASAQLYLIEAHLALKDVSAAQQLLSKITPEVERINTINLMGHLREVSGMVALASNQESTALRFFNQAISIREVMGDRYRQAVNCYYLGLTYVQQQELIAAEKSFAHAHTILTELQAQPMLKRVEEARQQLAINIIHQERATDNSEQIIAMLSRLIEAEFSREVLLHELFRLLHEELGLAPIVLLQEQPNHSLLPVMYYACNQEQALALAQTVARQEVNLQTARVYRLLERSEPLWLYVGNKQPSVPDSLLDLLIKQLQIGLKHNESPAKVSQTAPPPVPELHPLLLPGMVYCSPAMKKVVEQVLSLRSSDITVLITGETGTGKELVARAIHAFSKRAAHPFIPFNCAAAPRELIESQLFGHRRGAFTGATADFSGMIGAAEKGTLFLDEIGELAREMQPKLLRFLQNGEVQRIGETAPHVVDVRVLAATNRDLEEMVIEGTFRADLFYRLNVIQFYLPSLRERREEVPLLAEHFLARYTTQTEKKEISLSADVMSLLKQYDWPGNARQLENEIQRLVALASDGTKITPELLSPHIRNQAKIRLVTPLAPKPTQTTLAEAVAETERQLISNAFASHKGNITKVAAELGVSRYGLRKMLRRHQILPQRQAG
ncbi:MAG: sigma 54-interacting transcriptional regulator [Acidobacteria bacterium]|nr:sigma 54-interacting transcriptional regulator [Acidobacteriota bacterium]